MSDDRIPLSRSMLLSWKDPSLLTREELHRLVAILRAELKAFREQSDITKPAKDPRP